MALARTGPVVVRPSAAATEGSAPSGTESGAKGTRTSCGQDDAGGQVRAAVRTDLVGGGAALARTVTRTASAARTAASGRRRARTARGHAARRGSGHGAGRGGSRGAAGAHPPEARDVGRSASGAVHRAQAAEVSDFGFAGVDEPEPFEDPLSLLEDDVVVLVVVVVVVVVVLDEPPSLRLSAW